VSRDRLRFDHVGLNVAVPDAPVAWYETNFDVTRDFAFRFAQLGFASVILHEAGWRLDCSHGRARSPASGLDTSSWPA
jgi:hypothetical protein